MNDHYAVAVKGMASHPRASVDTLILGETEIHVATPEGSAHPQRAWIDLYGGALLFGGGEACRVGAQQQADRYGVRCFGVDYRLPPDFPYPAALDDCLAAYRHVLSQYSPADIVVIGRSAGGNLALAALLRGRDEGLPMPAGLVLLSPEVDLTESGDSFHTNRHVDVMLPLPLMPINQLYAGDADLAPPIFHPCSASLKDCRPPSCKRVPATCSCPMRRACIVDCAAPGCLSSSTSAKACPTAVSWTEQQRMTTWRRRFAASSRPFGAARRDRRA